jgi:glutamate-1-semialdehyde 2,1-aminomutase
MATTAESAAATVRAEVPREVLDYERAYVESNPSSRRLYEQALAVFPSGVTHDNRYLKPFPIYVERAAGSRKWDVDGNEYIDYLVGHGALLLGHSHPQVVDAVTRQMALGTHYGASHALEVQWGQLVQALLPSAEHVRFTASGTEATHMAMRLARAFAGRRYVLKLAGHFHGWQDYATVGVDPPFDVPMSPGIPEETLASVLTCAASRAGLEQAFAQHGPEIAAVILEPTGGGWGVYTMSPDVVQAARDLTRRYGALFIMDEVITGFRCSPGGAQVAFGVVPDLTTLAKVLAGGLPGGAVAGRADVLELLAFHDDSQWNRHRKIAHQGTFNANPLSAAAGVAALQIVATGEPQRHANRQAARLRRELTQVLAAYGLPGCVYGTFSMFHISPFHACPARDRPEGVDCPLPHGKLPLEVVHPLRRAMLVHGVDLAASGGMLSSAHTDADIDQTVQAFDAALRDLRADRVLDRLASPPESQAPVYQTL